MILAEYICRNKRLLVMMNVMLIQMHVMSGFHFRMSV